ncbi:gilatoxin-like [Hemicordylus capensis]|uniref:gilatoxin-like n=1 Tax=Hemicordylus capensis TaxID=884348 RepID=UPI0023049A8B|nr:gilatoxin-like [Hemicordylus capensis]
MALGPIHQLALASVEGGTCVTSAHHARIIGGEECLETEHPWLGQLYDRLGPYCSGTLLNRNWVITAAHCKVVPSQKRFQVRLGVHNTEVPTGHEQTRVSENVKCVKIVEGSSEYTFNTTDCSTYSEDIMLMQLNSPVVCTDYVAPLALPTSCASVGTVCRVMGWGTTTTPEETYPKVPHCVDVQIVSNEDCQAPYPWWEVSERMVCAGVEGGGKDSCRGDSGGPLICNDTLQGIVSLGGFPCAQPGQPGIYTNVCKFLAWIQETIGEDEDPCNPEEGTPGKAI